MLNLLHSISGCLIADINSLKVPLVSATNKRALRRLNAVAEHSPAFIELLAEPWLGEATTKNTLSIITHCARVHLYARILDDALDENLPIHRQNLLRAQPLLWDAVQRLSSGLPEDLVKEALQLITETVTAVELDDRKCTPLQWGEKNHHLLLTPLLLSGNSPAYQACRASLSILIALVQAGDEWRQGAMKSTLTEQEFLSFVTDSVSPETLSILRLHGWHGAAERIVWNAHNLLNVLSD